MSLDNPRNVNRSVDAGTSDDRVVLAHGGGGTLMHRLIDEIFVRTFDSDELRRGHDSAVLTNMSGRIAFTTDSFVVKPLFFPGGDIGRLAICGTVNDLAMCGARPRYISAGFIIEEGLPIETLRRIAGTMKSTADSIGVEIVTGDTKVVERGKCDGLYINTSGIGSIEHELVISPASIRSGDAILVNRDIGCHGIAVMSVREGLSFETEIQSDCAPLADTVRELIDGGTRINCLRDLTRGGLAAGLTELSLAANLSFVVDEQSVPVSLLS